MDMIMGIGCVMGILLGLLLGFYVVLCGISWIGDVFDKTTWRLKK